MPSSITRAMTSAKKIISRMDGHFGGTTIREMLQKLADHTHAFSEIVERDHTHTHADVGLGNLPNSKSDSISLDSSESLATSRSVMLAVGAIPRLQHIETISAAGISSRNYTVQAGDVYLLLANSAEGRVNYRWKDSVSHGGNMNWSGDVWHAMDADALGSDVACTASAITVMSAAGTATLESSITAAGPTSPSLIVYKLSFPWGS